MRSVFANPPASVQETCNLYIERKGVSASDPAALVLSEAVAFGCAATAGRQMAKLPATDRRCNTRADLSQVLQESEQVFMEVAHQGGLAAGAAN